MVDLTTSEIRALLWCSHVIDLGYSSKPPEGSVFASTTRKLLAELDQAKQLERHRSAGVLQQPEVVKQGTGWPS